MRAITKIDFAAIMAGIAVVYPNFKAAEDEKVLEIWYSMLCDIPKKTLQMTVRTHISTNVFPPTIADLRKLSAEIGKSKADWSIGWGLVTKAITSFGYYREQEALEYLAERDKLTAEVVKRLGFQSLCLSENQQTDRANFRMAYENLEDKEKYNLTLPPEARMPMLTLDEVDNKVLSDAVKLIGEMRNGDNQTNPTG